VRPLAAAASALFALAGPVHADSKLKECRDRYAASYQAEAGITREEWDGACRSGYDPDDYLESRKVQLTQREEYVVEEVLKTPPDELTPAQTEAFLAVHPEHLPPRLRKAYKDLRPVLAHRARQSAGGGGGPGEALDDVRAEAPPLRGPCTSRLASVYRKLGWDEMTYQENKALLKMARCREDQAEGQFNYCVGYDVKKEGGEELKSFHAFVMHKDPLDAMLIRVRGTDTSEGASSFFGLGGDLHCR
jgi:hypothetical protein